MQVCSWRFHTPVPVREHCLHEVQLIDMANRLQYLRRRLTRRVTRCHNLEAEDELQQAIESLHSPRSWNLVSIFFDRVHQTASSHDLIVRAAICGIVKIMYLGALVVHDDITCQSAPNHSQLSLD